MPSIGDLKSELSLDSRKFNKGVNKAQTKMKGFTKTLSAMRGPLVAAFGVAAVGVFVKNTLAQADAIGKFSDRIGISTTALQEWRFAFDKAGVSSEGVDKGLLNFVKNLGEARQGTGTLVTFLRKYDESLLNLLVSEDDNTKALGYLFTALGKAGNQADKVALANATLGRAGKEMVSAFTAGTKSFEAWIVRGRELGVVLDEHLIRKAEEVNDEISAASTAIKVKLQSAFLTAAPAILQFTELLNDALLAFNKFSATGTPGTEAFYERIFANDKIIKSLEADIEARTAGTIRKDDGLGSKFPRLFEGRSRISITELKQRLEDLTTAQNDLIKLQQAYDKSIEKTKATPASAQALTPALVQAMPVTKNKEPIKFSDFFETKEFKDLDFYEIYEEKLPGLLQAAADKLKEEKLAQDEINKARGQEYDLLVLIQDGNKAAYNLKVQEIALAEQLGRELTNTEKIELASFETQKESIKLLTEKNEKALATAQVEAGITATTKLNREREIILLETLVSGNQELYDLKVKQFNLEDSLDRNLTDKEREALEKFEAEKFQLNKTIEENKQTGEAIKEVWTAVGQHTEDVIVESILKTGAKLESLRDIAKAVLSDIVRSFARAQISPLVEAGTSFLSSAVSSGLSSLVGFKDGGSFKVPGAGGTDSQPVAFLASPGEQVDVRTPAQLNDSGEPPLVFTINQHIDVGVAQTVRTEMLNLSPLLINSATKAVLDKMQRGGRYSQVANA